MPTTQLERGWMNTNAKTLIDLATLKLINTVLLDNVDSGAANPWGAAWTADGKTVVVAHAGTHEISVVDIPGLLHQRQGDGTLEVTFVATSEQALAEWASQAGATEYKIKKMSMEDQFIEYTAPATIGRLFQWEAGK